MSVKTDDECLADCLIQVTVIVVSDDDADECENFRSVKKRGWDRERKAQERWRKSYTDKEDAQDPRLSTVESHKKTPPFQQSPKYRRRYLSYQSQHGSDKEAGEGRFCPKLSPSPKRSPEKSENAVVKKERGEAGGRGRMELEHVCEDCGYSTNSSYNLACHTRTHTGERPYRCECCGLRFRTRSCLNRHTRGQSCLRPPGVARRPPPKAQPLPLECADCDYSTPHAYNLKVHRRVHSGERPYDCGQCHLAFRTQSHLYRHERCHRKQAE